MKRQQALLVRKTLLVRKAHRPALEHEFNLEQMTFFEFGFSHFGSSYPNAINLMGLWRRLNEIYIEPLALGTVCVCRFL